MEQRKGMFAAFADDDEDHTTTQGQKAVAPKKVAQPKPAAEKKEEKPQVAKGPRAVDGTGFDGVTGQDAPQRGGRGGRGGDRGGDRGGRGGERGARGAFRGERRPRVEGEERPKFEGERRPRAEGEEFRPREFRPRTEGGDAPRGRGERRPRVEGEERPKFEGERRPRVEGEYRPRTEGEYRPRTEGGERGGRGRGDRRPRPQGEVATTAEGDVEHKDHHAGHEGKERRFTGKPREEYHPLDRRDGTGRGRGSAKGGAGKGNWGTVDDEVKQGTPEGEETKEGEEVATTPAEEAKVEDAPVETKEPAFERREVVDEEDEANKSKLTFAEYQALKKKALQKKEIRGHDEAKRTGLEAAAPKTEKVVPLVKNLKDQEVYNVAVGKTELSNLLTFQSHEDEIYIERGEGGARRGGRGGRGGARGGRGGKPEGGHRGPRQQQLRLDDNAFPTLA